MFVVVFFSSSLSRIKTSVLCLFLFVCFWYFCVQIVVKELHLFLSHSVYSVYAQRLLCSWLKIPSRLKHWYFFPILTIHLFNLLLLIFPDSTVLFSNKAHIHMHFTFSADHLGCFPTLAPAVVSSLT